MSRPPLMTKWINALRSGYYKQGPGFLCYNDHYCCLGVRADISGELSPNLINSKLFGIKERDGHLITGIPPKGILESWGLTEEQAHQLIHWNDSDWGDHKTFEQIADVLEEWFPDDRVEIVQRNMTRPNTFTLGEYIWVRKGDANYIVSTLEPQWGVSYPEFAIMKADKNGGELSDLLELDGDTVAYGRLEDAMDYIQENF